MTFSSQLLEDDRGPRLVAGVDVRQLALVVPATAPADAPQVGAVRDGEVVERAEQVLAQGVPQPQLGGGAPVEELGADVDAVGALGGCGEAEQLARGQVVEEPSVRRRLGVVELVDDHDVVGVGRDVRDAVRLQGLHAGEDVVPTLRARAGDVQLTERGVGEDFSVGPQRLLEDLLAVRDEEQSRPVGWRGPAQSAVVKCGDHRLAGPGGGDDQIAMAIVHVALDSRARRACAADR